MSFRRTLAVSKLLKLKKRKRVVQGGTWAGKTFGIIACVIDTAIKNTGWKITVVAETIPALKEGALSQFKSIMMATGRWNEERYNATDRSYFFANGTEVQFKSFDSVGKAQAAGKRNALFINEAPYISWEIADALITRTTDIIWVDFNPTSEFWAHTELLSDPDSEFLLLKYTDNEALPDSILHELQLKIKKAETSEYWANWCRVYIDGEIGNLDGVVFPVWRQIDSLPDKATLELIGVDFGFTNSFTAIIARYRYEGKMLFHELAYQRGMKNAEIADVLRPYSGMCEIAADSEDPRTISEISDLGILISAVDKHKDSIQSSIQQINEDLFYVTASSRNLIKELRGYVWAKDQSGKPMNVPVKKNDHACDAMRYSVLGTDATEIEWEAY